MQIKAQLDHVPDLAAQTLPSLKAMIFDIRTQKGGTFVVTPAKRELAPKIKKPWTWPLHYA